MHRTDGQDEGFLDEVGVVVLDYGSKSYYLLSLGKEEEDDELLTDWSFVVSFSCRYDERHMEDISGFPRQLAVKESLGQSFRQEANFNEEVRLADSEHTVRMVGDIKDIAADDDILAPYPDL